MSSQLSIFFPNSIKILRKTHSLTTRELAKKINLDYNTLRTYEFNGDMPSYPVLIKFALFFQISLDYLVVGNGTPFVHNINFLKLAVQIDSLGVNERYKIESSASTLLKKNMTQLSKFDRTIKNLSQSFHYNLKIIRKALGFSQADLARELDVNRVQVTRYEKDGYPRIKKLVKLSQLLNISIHALLTGERLFYPFSNAGLKNIILQADKNLSLEEIKFITHLMERIIEDAN